MGNMGVEKMPGRQLMVICISSEKILGRRMKKIPFYYLPLKENLDLEPYVVCFKNIQQLMFRQVQGFPV